MDKINLLIQTMGQSILQREVDYAKLYLTTEERWVSLELNDVACADNLFLKIKLDLNEYYVIFEQAFISYFKNVLNIDTVDQFKIYKSNKKNSNKSLSHEIDQLKTELVEIDDELGTRKTTASVIKNNKQKRKLEILEFRLRNYLNEEVLYENI